MQLSNAAARKPQQIADLSDLYIKYVEKYEHVFMQEFGESGVFIFKALGRKDYRDIVSSTAITDCEKEEMICSTCVLYPENYDFENCDEAGLPTLLSKSILENSLLTNPESLKNLVYHFRDEMNTDYNKQVSCIIHEAFPEYEITGENGIENWDIIKTAEYISRAEFILHSLRGVPIAQVNTEQSTPSSHEEIKQKSDLSKKMKTAQLGDEDKKSSTKKLNASSLSELQRLAPDINWYDDAGRKGIEGILHGQNFDARARSSIPLDDSEEGQDAIPLALRNKFKVIDKKDK